MIKSDLEEVMRRKISVFLIVLGTALGSVSASAHSFCAKEKTMKSLRTCVFDECKKACRHGLNRECCVCSGGWWIHGHCA